MNRRALLRSAAASALLTSWPASAAAPASRSRLIEVEVAGRRVAVLVPVGGPDDALYPVVIALHGRGEAKKSPAEGALGWPKDYAMTRAIDRLHAPPLASDDFEGLVEPERIAKINADLGTSPYRGVIVVCPKVPDLAISDAAAVAKFGDFLTGELLEFVRTETPALSSPEATGIDGVSLGGVLALDIGLARPEAFGAVGSLQAAIKADDAAKWAERARAARKIRPELRLRLTTSEGDVFKAAIAANSKAWKAAGVAHDYAVWPGPHDYVWNRGPGSYELLTWHDKNLRRS